MMLSFYAIFILVSGMQPAKTVIFNKDCIPIFDLGSSYRNSVFFSPQGRFLMIGGFGNLSGDMDFWEMKDKSFLGTTKAHCTVSAGWSPDAKGIFTAVLNPRLRIDNGVTIYSGSGKKICAQPYAHELYEVMWIGKGVENEWESATLAKEEKKKQAEQEKKKPSWSMSVPEIDAKMGGLKVSEAKIMKPIVLPPKGKGKK